MRARSMEGSLLLLLLLLCHRGAEKSVSLFFFPFVIKGHCMKEGGKNAATEMKMMKIIIFSVSRDCKKEGKKGIFFSLTHAGTLIFLGVL